MGRRREDVAVVVVAPEDLEGVSDGQCGCRYFRHVGESALELQTCCRRAADVPAQAQRFPQRSDDQRAEQPRPSSSTTISEVTLLLMSPVLNSSCAAEVDG